MTRFITSHSFRVRRAKREMQQLPDCTSKADRQGLVEFYLLEDVLRLYEHRLEIEKGKTYTSKTGLHIQAKYLEKFHAIIIIYTSVIEAAWAKATAGEYRVIAKAINEKSLMKAARSVKYLPRLREIGQKFLREIDEGALFAVENQLAMDEDLELEKAHDANVRYVKGIPSVEETNPCVNNVEPVSDKNVETGSKIINKY